MVRSLTTWLWLIDIEETDCALDASAETTGDLAASLMGHFSTVRVLRPHAATLEQVRASNIEQGWSPTEMAVGTAQTAPWPAATFDCITLHDALVRRETPLPEMTTELSHYRRMLKPGGWLALASPQPRVRGRDRSGQHGIPRRRLARVLRRAGFRDVRCLFAEFSLERPLFIIPDDRAVVNAYEASDAMRGTARWHRRLVARLGVRSPLYPAYLLLARA